MLSRHKTSSTGATGLKRQDSKSQGGQVGICQAPEKILTKECVCGGSGGERTGGKGRDREGSAQAAKVL